MIQSLIIKTGLIVARAAVLRININTDGRPAPDQ
jgi:hypothetical protein